MNINKLMKQAQQMQTKMQEMQEKLADMEVEGVSGGGLIKVTVNGKGEAKKVEIDKSLMDPEEDDSNEVLGDLIVAAFNDAKTKVETATAEEMQKVTGGMGLPPGMNLPF